MARYTLDVMTLCEGAGYDVVVVETVGLGQSEVKVGRKERTNGKLAKTHFHCSKTSMTTFNLNLSFKPD